MIAAQVRRMGGVHWLALFGHLDLIEFHINVRSGSGCKVMPLSSKRDSKDELCNALYVR